MTEPRISLSLHDDRRQFRPGEILHAQYQLDALDPHEIHAVEASVLWYTEGKGDEDMAVHFFQRRLPADADGGDLSTLHVLQARLPNSPLSYSGVIVKIRWCVRLRVFLRRGREVCVEVPFQLGHVPAAAGIEDPQSALPGSQTGIEGGGAKPAGRETAPIASF